MPLGSNRWGKSGVRISKVLRGPDSDDFVDLTVQVLLEGDVASAHTEGDNSFVLPTDTMRNTVYALAQSHLTRDLERFAGNYRRLSIKMIAEMISDPARSARRRCPTASIRCSRTWTQAALTRR